jgi:hypothetical protein
MLVHTVYFWLKPDLAAAQRAEFVRLVHKLGEIKSAEKRRNVIYCGLSAGVGNGSGRSK